MCGLVLEMTRLERGRYGARGKHAFPPWPRLAGRCNCTAAVLGDACTSVRAFPCAEEQLR